MFLDKFKQDKIYSSIVVICTILDIKESVWGKKFDPIIPPPLELNEAYIDLLKYAKSGTTDITTETGLLFGAVVNSLYADYQRARAICKSILPNIDDYCDELIKELALRYPSKTSIEEDNYGKRRITDTSDLCIPKDLEEITERVSYYLTQYYEGILPGEITKEKYYDYLDLYDRPIVKKGNDVKYKLIKTRFEDLHLQAYGKTFILKKPRSGARPYILMKYLYDNPSEIIYRDDIKEYKDTNTSLLEIITSLRLPPYIKHLFFSASSDHAILVPEITFEEFFDQKTDEDKIREYLKKLQVV